MTAGNDNSLVSVVIPAFKAELFLEETIGSVRLQGYRPIEVVVVEDCSPDGTATVAQRLADQWNDGQFEIRLIRQETNQGGAAALSRGFREAGGDFLCWLSADDAFVGTTKLAEQVAQIRAGADVSYSKSFYRGPSASDMSQNELVSPAWHPHRAFVNRVILARGVYRLLGLIFKVPINGSTIMIARHAWERYGDFDSALGNIDQDSDMWMRYSAQGARFAFIDGPAGFYRIHPDQTSGLVEACVVGVAATRIRMIMAYERVGLLPRLLLHGWPVLAGAERWEWYRGMPAAVVYLCEAGLKSSRNPLVRRTLRRLSSRVAEEGLVEQSTVDDAVTRAEAILSSPLFGDFQERLRRSGVK